MSATTTTIMPTDRCADELDLILRDLAATGRSCASDRALRLAHAALAARTVAYDEAQRIDREARRIATASRRQARREAIAEARARYWGARR